MKKIYNDIIYLSIGIFIGITFALGHDFLAIMGGGLAIFILVNYYEKEEK